MTSSDLGEINLGALIRTAVNASVKQAMSKVRTPSTLAGRVEELDQDLDVAYVRMDLEAMGGDPTQSDNYENPGVIPTTRLGEANNDDTVRVQFDGTAGASSFRTSNENVIILPYGAESGRRIIADGNLGRIEFYDEDDTLVGLLDTDLWAMGDIDPPGARAEFDPVGGLRMRDALDHLVSILDQNGYVLRNSTTGLVTADLHHGGLRLVDPNGTDDIELVTTSAGTLQTPSWVAAAEVNPSSSLVIPAAPTFTSTPADDISIGHVAAWLRLTNQAATMTPPAGYTERHDGADVSGAGTLQTSVATKDPADGTTATFTSTQTNWQHAIGTHVIIKGGGSVSPAYGSITTSFQALAGGKATATIAKPSGVVANEVLLAFVAIGVSGGYVPTGWTTPDGFTFLGASVSTSGTGSTQSTLAVGVWAKLTDATDVAATDYSTTITLPSGLKSIHGAMVRVSSPYLVSGGVQIRLAGHPIKRLLKLNELSAAGTILCDFTNIPQGYDNLELIIDATSDQNGAVAGTPQRYRMRFNGDVANNYFYQITEFQDATTTAQVAAAAAATSRILMAGVNGLNGSASSMICNLLGYARPGGNRVMHASAFWVTGALGANMRNGAYRGQYIGGAINRITVEMDATPPRFAAGSRAYLYGY